MFQVVRRGIGGEVVGRRRPGMPKAPGRRRLVTKSASYCSATDPMTVITSLYALPFAPSPAALPSPFE